MRSASVASSSSCGATCMSYSGDRVPGLRLGSVFLFDRWCVLIRAHLILLALHADLFAVDRSHESDGPTSGELSNFDVRVLGNSA